MNLWDIAWTVLAFAVVTALFIVAAVKLANRGSKPSVTDEVSDQSSLAQSNPRNRGMQNPQLTDEQAAEGARMAKVLGHGEETAVDARPIKPAFEHFYHHSSNGACLERWHHSGEKDGNGLTFTGLGLRKVV